ncbi:hypothetical protein BRN30_12925, partial [Xanthomonas oryzae pv. oryzae]
MIEPGLGSRDWGLGIGDWGLVKAGQLASSSFLPLASALTNPQSQISNSRRSYNVRLLSQRSCG